MKVEVVTTQTSENREPLTLSDFPRGWEGAKPVNNEEIREFLQSLTFLELSQIEPLLDHYIERFTGEHQKAPYATFSLPPHQHISSAFRLDRLNALKNIFQKILIVIDEQQTISDRQAEILLDFSQVIVTIYEALSDIHTRSRTVTSS